MIRAAEARCGAIVHWAEEGVGAGNVEMGRKRIDGVDMVVGKAVLSAIGRGSVGIRVSHTAIGREISIEKKGSIPGDGTGGKILPMGRGGGRVSVIYGRMEKPVGRTMGRMKGSQMIVSVLAGVARADGINVVVVREGGGTLSVMIEAGAGVVRTAMRGEVAVNVAGDVERMKTWSVWSYFCSSQGGHHLPKTLGGASASILPSLS